MIKIERRIPLESYAYWNVVFEGETYEEIVPQLKTYPNIKKVLQQLDMTPEKRFEEELGEPQTKIDDTEVEGATIFKR